MPPRKSANGTTDTPPRRTPAKRDPTKPLKYSRAVVEALVKMLEGAALLIPAVRNQPVTEAEHKWLVDDWYEFGLGNAWFQKLVLSTFSNSIYVRLASSHTSIFGSRVIGYEMAMLDQTNRERINQGQEPIPLPQPLLVGALLVNGATVVRTSADSQDEIIAQLQALEELENVDAGPARDGSGQDWLGQDELSPQSFETARARRHAGDQG